MNGTGREPCERGEALVAGARPLVSALMFSAGLLGNLLALGLLLRCRRPPRARPPSLFHVLVLALVVTDLLGTCSVSPLVLASYHRNLTLTALARGGHLCLYFGFSMSFFGLATMLILFAMALERCLALGRPYFYERFLSPRTGLVALPAIYTFSAAFCSLPLVGFGRYVQYCPGTWCFIQMYLDDGRHAAEEAGMHVTFSLLYATLLLLLILSVLLCNLSVISNLARMHRRGQKTRRMAAPEQPRAAGGGGRCMFSMAEEIDHLLLLAIMTITFVICSLPFTVSATTSSQGVSPLPSIPPSLSPVLRLPSCSTAPKSKLLPKARETSGLAQTAGDSRCSRGARDSPTPSPPAEASRPGRVAPHNPGTPGSPGVAITKGHVRSPRRREGWQGEERGTERWGWGGRKPRWAGLGGKQRVAGPCSPHLGAAGHPAGLRLTASSSPSPPATAREARSRVSEPCRGGRLLRRRLVPIRSEPH